MYVDDPGLDTLLSLTTDQLLSCTGGTDTAAIIASVVSDDDVQSSPPPTVGRRRNRRTPKSDDDKQLLPCTYPNCNKSYLKPSHLKVSYRPRQQVAFTRRPPPSPQTFSLSIIKCSNKRILKQKYSNIVLYPSTILKVFKIVYVFKIRSVQILIPYFPYNNTLSLIFSRIRMF